MCYSCNDALAFAPWCLPEFGAFLHAELPLVILTAPDDLAGQLSAADGQEDAKYRALPDTERALMRPRHLLVGGVRGIFQPSQVPMGYKGYTATPVLVGDIMPWPGVVPGTGRWYFAWDQLQRRLASFNNMEPAVHEVRMAMERKWWDMGYRPGANGTW